MEVNAKDVKVIKGRGGYRPGCGRKAGSKNLVNIKKALIEYMSPQELKNLVERLKRWAKSDKKVAMFIAEQIFGKAKTSANVQHDGKVLHIGAMLDELQKLPETPTHENSTTYNPEESTGTITLTPENYKINGREITEQGISSSDPV